MSDLFIIYKPYKDLSTIECLLMCWIVSLHNARQPVCFSNEYASRVLKVSVSTITRAITNLKSLGFINTFQPLGDRRFIHLLKQPEIEVINLEVCDLEGVINLTTPPNQIDDTPNQIDDTPSSQRRDPLVNLTTNNKEYNKAYNDTNASYDYDLRFKNIINQFPKSKQKGIEDAYNYTWIFLKEEDKKQIEKVIPLYLKRNEQTPIFIKTIAAYFNDKFWITDEITLNLIPKPEKKKIKF